ncbi:Rieske (2Fe-2S) protein [Mycobacterium sp. E1747]|uniref:Rieske (2Fe-2S) protein n=1 Tax=Mycobacterium sp. E1747 TaxID=1834128 RepID=UPI0009EE6688|nr:Rieske (2Fe-2S) protein [Mycobacterium sp. E1747]
MVRQSATNGADPDAGPADGRWVLWGKSDELKPGKVLPTTVGGRHLVIWREQSGALRCLDGVCRHLGAHLGYGGEVVENRLVCPFHGWAYDADGNNVDQPGIEADPSRRSNICLPSYGVAEVHGLVFLSADRNVEGTRAQAFCSTLREMVGDGEAREGEIVTGRPLRWALTLPTSKNLVADPGSDGWSWPNSRAVFEWLLSGRAGERVIATSDPRWTSIQPTARVEGCAGPLSAVNGTHSAAPTVQFLQVVTDPTLESCTIGGGVQVARIHVRPPALTNSKPRRRHERMIRRTLGASRLLCSITQINDQTLAVTCVGVYPSRRSARWAVPAADAVLMGLVGRRLRRLATALDTARLVVQVSPATDINLPDEWVPLLGREPTSEALG